MSSNLLNRPRTTSDTGSFVAKSARKNEASPSRYSRGDSNNRTATLLNPMPQNQVREEFQTTIIQLYL